MLHRVVTNVTTPPPPSIEYLFSYGTLQLASVQMANFGRLLQGRRDTLPGYSETMIEIDDATTIALSGESQHPIARYTGRSSDSISGTVFELSPEELRKADAYEVQPYTRARARLGSGADAWVYVDAAHMPPQSPGAARRSEHGT